MRTLAIFASAAVALTAPACASSDCQDEAACDAVVGSDGLGTQPLEGRQSEIFRSGGVSYSLVHVEYGVGQDCPAGCFFSHLCAFVVGGETKPIYFSFTRAPEVLPAVQAFCAPRALMTSDADCALPGLTLPIIADPSFQAWAMNESDDEMRWCRGPLANAYLSGKLPR